MHYKAHYLLAYTILGVNVPLKQESFYTLSYHYCRYKQKALIGYVRERSCGQIPSNNALYQ